MAGMPRLLAVARRPLAASLYRVVYSVANRLPASATASSPPVRDFARRCSLPCWEMRVAVRSFSSSSGGGGGPVESIDDAQGQTESHAVEEEGRPKTKRRSRSKTSAPTSPPARSSKEEKRCTYLRPVDPGLRNLGGAASCIGKGAVAAVDTEASNGAVSTGAVSAIVEDTVDAVDTDASNGAVASVIGEITVAAVDTEASTGGLKTREETAIAEDTVASLDTDASNGAVNAGAASAMNKATVPSVNAEASDSGVNTGAVSCIGKDPVSGGGVDTVAAGAVDTDMGTNAAVGMAKEAGHGVEGTPTSSRKLRARRTRVKAAAAEVPEKPAAAGVGKVVTSVERGVLSKADDAAPRKRRRQDRLADAMNHTGNVSMAGVDTHVSNSDVATGVVSKDKRAPNGIASEAGDDVEGTSVTCKKTRVRRTRVKPAAAVPEKPEAVETNAVPRDQVADVKNDQATGKGSSGRVTGGPENDKVPGNGAGAEQNAARRSGAEASSHPGGKSSSNAAESGEMGAEKTKLRITLAQYLRALEKRIERGMFETRVHFERKLSWVVSSFESKLEKHMRKSLDEQQVAMKKLHSKQTSRLFFGLLAQLLGLVGACFYVAYKYGWAFVEQKVYELPYDDRAKAVALQVFDGAIKYAVAKITLQHTRAELRKKLPLWLGGKMDEKKEEEEKEEKATHPWWWWLWPPNLWKNKKEQEKKRKEEEEKKRKEGEAKRRKEEEEEKKRNEYSRWWWLTWLWPGNWGRSKGGGKEEGEKKEYSSRLWCLWPGYWWWLLSNWWWSKKDEEDAGNEVEVEEK